MFFDFLLWEKTIKTPIIKKIKGKTQSASVLNFTGGFKRIKSPYLSVKNLYISHYFFLLLFYS